MNHCSWKNEVAQTVREGRWPSGCTEDLRNHVASCTACSEEARLLSAFVTARGISMHIATLQSPELLWWKAQLRKRHQAMEQMEGPGLAISTATIAASIVILIVVLSTAWKQIHWVALFTTIYPTGWSTWMTITLTAALSAFAVVAMVIGLGWAEERG
ncbi:MAG TPA: hypothetical protein VIM67_03990 [Terriglobus sp.]